MKFRATILLAGKTATGIEVPHEVIAGLDSGKKPPVRVTIGDHTYRTTIAPRGERFLIPVSAENRESAGISAGDEVDVEVEVDTEPREVTVPPDLAAVLERDAKASEFFGTLSYSQKKWYVLPIEQAKTDETRQRRLAKAIEMLREGRKR
ncbi:MAG TPA: YdeI/OmpD-associated family protein [Thermoleophilaceae bacterium]|nr:YdeI/OmpD-associated family protein [Thermoleophilaceae bacterium]